LAWRNTLRNKRRTLLTVTAVMVAVAALTYGQAHINGLLNNVLDTYARTESGHIRIREDGYTERARFLPLHLNIQHLADLLPVVRSNPGVEEALPRIRTAVLVDGANSNRPGLLLGIDLAREEGYLNPSAMAGVGRLPEPGRPEVMVGREFAEELAVSVGDTITLLGQTAYRSLGGARLTVTGLIVSGMAYFDNTFLIAPLDQVQAMVDLQDATTEIVVFATDPERADELAQHIRGELDARGGNELEVLSWRDQGEIVRMLDMVKPVLGVILFLLMLMACLIIINTMLMTVMERTQEFGMQAALGMRRSDIVKLILAEGMISPACRRHVDLSPPGRQERPDPGTHAAAGSDGKRFLVCSIRRCGGHDHRWIGGYLSGLARGAPHAGRSIESMNEQIKRTWAFTVWSPPLLAAVLNLATARVTEAQPEPREILARVDVNMTIRTARTKARMTITYRDGDTRNLVYDAWSEGTEQSFLEFTISPACRRHVDLSPPGRQERPDPGTHAAAGSDGKRFLVW
jgi:putative ABC transport system permease protein